MAARAFPLSRCQHNPAPWILPRKRRNARINENDLRAVPRVFCRSEIVPREVFGSLASDELSVEVKRRPVEQPVNVGAVTQRLTVGTAPVAIRRSAGMVTAHLLTAEDGDAGGSGSRSVTRCAFILYSAVVPQSSASRFITRVVGGKSHQTVIRLPDIADVERHRSDPSYLDQSLSISGPMSMGDPNDR